MKRIGALSFTAGIFLACSPWTQAGEVRPPSAPEFAKGNLQTYVLTPNDLVELRIYQEEDLDTKFRVAKDGSANLPLIGVVQIGGKTIAQATRLLRDLFDKDYLVNPQVTLTVVEYAKRRFTVLGQVHKPGSFEIPNEETVTLLQAIAMAGGFNRLANQSRLIVTRTVDGQKTTATVDARSAAKDPDTRPFVIMPDDTITVQERIF